MNRATIGQLLLGHEAGDIDPANALFGNSQREGHAWAGKKPSEMTLGELHDFQRQRGPGSYFEWVKQNNKGVGSSPAGSIQLIGDTLGTVMQQMNLNRDDMYDVPMQMDIGRHLINNRLAIARGDPDEEVRQLGLEWDGLRHVDPDILKEAIVAYKEDPSTFGLPGLDSSADDPAHRAMMSSRTRKSDTPLATFGDILGRKYQEQEDLYKKSYTGVYDYEMQIGSAFFPFEKERLKAQEAAEAQAAAAAAAEESDPRRFSANRDLVQGNANNAAFNIGVGGPTNDGNVSTSGTQEPAEKEARKLFNPTAQNVGELLSGLGVGFGQMSAGQPVNMMPTVMGLRKQRADAAQQELDNQQAERDRARQVISDQQAAARLKLEERRVVATERRLKMDDDAAAATAAGKTVMPFSDEVRADIETAYPFLAPSLDRHANLVAEGKHAEAAKLGEQIYQAATVEPDAASAMMTPEAVTEFLGLPPEQQAALIGAADAQTRAAMTDAIQAMDGVTPTVEAREIDETLERYRALPTDPGTYSENDDVARVQIEQELRNRNAAKSAEAMSQTMTLLAEKDALRTQGQMLVKANTERREIIKQGPVATGMSSLITDGKEAAINIANAGGTTGNFSGALAKAYNIMGQGGEELGKLRAEIERITGVPAADLLSLDEDGAAFMFAFGSNLGMLNQGFSDADRVALMKTIPGVANTPTGRVDFLARFESDMLYKQAAARLAAASDPTSLESVSGSLDDIGTTLDEVRQPLTEYLKAQMWLEVNDGPLKEVGAPHRAARDELATFYKISDPEERKAVVEKAYPKAEDYAALLARTGYMALTEEQYNLLKPVMPPGFKARDPNDASRIWGLN